MAKTNFFEIILLVVGISAAYLGFSFINQLYLAEGALGWDMVIAIFLWLIMLLLFILLSLNVNIAKNQLQEIQHISKLFEEKFGSAGPINPDHQNKMGKRKKR